jgi:hypothetical protein
VRHRPATGEYADPEWYRKAEGALKAKKSGLQKIQNIKARLTRAEKESIRRSKDYVLLNVIREIAPDTFERALDEARRRHPELW